MIAHPLVLGILIIDGATLIGTAFSAWAATQVFSRWRPESSDVFQLSLERRVEIAALVFRAAGALFALSTAAYVTAVASIFPDIVTGAMCGTGVMNAMGSMGERALVLRLLTLLFFFITCSGMALDAKLETSPLVPINNKLLLVVSPMVLLSVSDTAHAMLSMNTAAPVDCCSALRNTVLLETGERGPLFSDNCLIAGTNIGGILLFVVSVIARARRHCGPASVLQIAVLAAIFTVFGTIGLIRVFSAYHYQVLAHHCPWCLFLGEHYFVGYPLFSALLVIVLESGAVAFALFAAQKAPAVERFSKTRMQRAMLTIIFCLILYALLTALPPLWWRLRYGTWIGG